MKKISITSAAFIFLAFSSFLIGQEHALTAADYARAEKMLIFGTAPLVDRAGVRPTFLPDGRFWYRVLTPTGSEYVLVKAADGSRTTGDSLAKLGITAATLSGESGDPNAITSPDGTKAAYIKNFNLWLKELATGREMQLTTDGAKDFGYATDNAGWKHSDRAILVWSPDSKKIATFQQDERNVSDSYLVSTNVGAPKLSDWKSALPGDPYIAMIQRVIIDVDAAKVTRLQMQPDPHRSTLCDDVSCDGGWDDVFWSPDSSKLAFVSTSRDHKKENLRVADAATGAVRDVYEEVSATQFESSPMGGGGANWRYLPATNEFIWYSESDGWGHLYLYDLTTGKLKNRITAGEFAVWKIANVNEKDRVIYFEAGGREKGNDPYFSYTYSVRFNGTDLTLLTPENANHNVSWSPDNHYFIDNYSTPNSPPVSVLRDARGKLVANLEKAVVSRLAATGWRPPTPVTVKARDGVTDLYGLMYTPTNFDPIRKYPIIDYIYPGPQGGSIGSRSFSPSRGDNQALAELGFVVVEIDGTCNPLRSKKFHDMCYGNMADNTLPDQIAAIKELAAKNPFMDLDRVGIWGHSGGGFAAAAAMFRYPDFFKVGISESGNHDNRNYEDDWGERYIGLLTKDASGKSNYEDQSNQNFAKNLKGHLLLAHGTMDDNVPPNNTLLVVDALIKANKDFDLIMIPNAHHGYGTASFYMMRRRWDYFVRYLLGAEPPKDYEIRPRRDPRMSQ